MPSPDLLGQRLRDAVVAQDRAAFDRWARHPRFNPGHPSVVDAILAALRLDAPEEWLSALAGLGVNLRRFGADEEPIHAAARDGRVRAVAWLLDHGVPANARTSMGQSLAQAMLARESKPDHLAIWAMLWRQTPDLEALVGWQNVTPVLTRAPAAWFQHSLDEGWDPTVQDDGDRSVLERVLEIPDVPDATRAVFRAWSLARSLPASGPGASVPRPRL